MGMQRVANCKLNVTLIFFQQASLDQLSDLRCAQLNGNAAQPQSEPFAVSLHASGCGGTGHSGRRLANHLNIHNTPIGSVDPSDQFI
jgi:hypothetical protein